MIHPKEFYSKLTSLGYEVFTGVPCSFFKGLISFFITDSEYIAASNEGSALAIAAGSYFAGKKSVVLLQNSGVGNLIDPLTSLNLIYKIPALLLISGRGYKIEDEPQHEIMGKTTNKILSDIGIKVFEFNDYGDLEKANNIIEKEKIPVALIIKKNTFGEYSIEDHKKEIKLNEQEIYLKDKGDLLKRYDVIKIISNYLNKDVLVVSTTGKISRELFIINDRSENFYMQGSMGYAASIGFGLALNQNKKVLVLDGDGAVIMHMGCLSTIGYYSPKNFIHVVLDNEAYESTGCQYTTSSSTRLEEIAKNCGYRRIYKVFNQEDIEKAINDSLNNDGPSFILIKVNLEKVDVPRITGKYTAKQIALNFLKSVRE